MSAQSGFTLITASNITDLHGLPLAAGTIVFTPVTDQGQPVGFRIGGASAGQAITRSYRFPVVNGAIQTDGTLIGGVAIAPQLPDTSLTYPENICYSVQVLDPNTNRNLLGPGYGSFQPTGPTASFDDYEPDQPANVTVQRGPQGPPGEVTLQQLHDAADANDLSVRSYGSNILNPANVIPNHFVSVPIGPGNLVSYTGSDFNAIANIRVQPGDKIATNFGVPDGNIGYAWCDINNNPLGGVQFPSAIGTPQVAPTGAAYYQASLYQVNLAAAMIVRSNAAGTPVIPSVFVPYLALISESAVSSIVASQLSTGSPTVHLAVLPAATTDLAVNQPDMFGSTTPAVANTTITKITMTAQAPWAATTMQVQVMTPASSGSPANFTVASVQTINIPANSGSGYVTFTLNAGVDFDYIPMLAGQIATYRTLGLAVGYATGTSGGFWRNSNFGAGTYHSAGDVVNMTSSSGATICFDCVTQATLPAVNPLQVQAQVSSFVDPAIASAVAGINASLASAPKKRTQLFEPRLPRLGTAYWMDDDWVRVDGERGRSDFPSSGQGLGAYIQSPQMYGLEQRVMRLRFSLSTAGSIVGLGAVGANVSLVTLNNVNQTLNIMAGISSTALASVPLGFTLQTGVVYTLIATLNERALTVSLGDTLGGTVASVTLDENTTFNGSIPDLGLWADFNAVFAIAGQFSVSNLTALADIYQPDVMCIGDSITFGPFCTLAQKWTQILKGSIPFSSLIASGKPGGDTNSVITRMTTEVSVLLPKYLVVLIGINDFGAGATLSQYQTNMNNILSAAQTLGAKVVLCCLCTNGSLQSIVTSANTWLRSLVGTFSVVACVRFDIATSTTVDGNTQDTTKFHSDNLHPNEIGAAAMAARFPIDAPMLFD